MRYWMDTEFIEDGKTIDLISIGIACEDGREYYAQSLEFDIKQASEWVKKNVIPHLSTCGHPLGSTFLPDEIAHHRYVTCENTRCTWRTREQIKRELLAFLHPDRYGYPELWGYYSAYDHVAFAQIWGTMMDLPSGYPMYTRDIKQWCDALGCSKLPAQEGDEHNALADARWNKIAWGFLREWANDGITRWDGEMP